MQISNRQQEVLQRLANDSDGEVLKSFLVDVMRHYADVRNLVEPTKEGIMARQLACTILEEEIISRLSKKTENITNKEEYE